MQCDICFRHHSKELPFLCAVDARNKLYPVRLDIARVLLEKDALSKEVEAEISPSAAASTTDEKSQAPPDSPSARSILDHNVAEKEYAEDRTMQIIAHADELREKINQLKATRAAKQKVVAQRRADLTGAKDGAEKPWQARIEEAEKSMKRTRFKWNKQGETLGDARTYLCCEAAKLYGLRRGRVKRNGALVEEYRIGGLSIMDLRDLNNFTPAHITTVLSHIAHILVLSTHYLSIRLPAEITLPHRDYPLPTIFTLTTSYQMSNVPFPGSTTAHSSSNSPTTSRHGDMTTEHRPRPLFVDKHLHLLAKEDPATYKAFMEGVTLLAYNIAWVCKSQFIPVGENSTFEDVCAIGVNFFNLLIGPSPKLGPPAQYAQPPKEGEGDTKVDETQRMTRGRFSHGTSQTFLAGAEGQEFVRSWKLLNPIKLADRLKGQLMSELTGAEWEILDQKSWEVDEEEVAVMVTPKEGLPAGENDAGEERKAGVSGWTKLKSR